MSGGWSDEETETLKTMWAEGTSASQIARAVGGRTRNAVLGKVHRLGLPERSTGSFRAQQKRTHVAAPRPETVRTETRKAIEDTEDPGPMDPPLTTLSVRDHHCKWPYDVGSTYHYCGQSPEKGRPFCSFHCAKAYQPQQPRKSAA